MPARSNRERGAGTVEFAGLVVLAALILGVMIPIIAPPVKDKVADALCKILHLGDSGTCETSADKKYKPASCTTASSTNTYGASVSVAIFNIGQDVTFVQTTSTDNSGKKTVTVTEVPSTSLGVGTGIGVGAHGGKVVNAGADASVAAGVKVGQGDSWQFKDGAAGTAEDQARKFIGGIREKAAIQAEEHSGVTGWLIGHTFDAVAGPDIPDPDIKRTEFSADANAGVTAGLGLGPPDSKGKHQKTPPTTKPEKPKSRREKFNEKYDKRSKQYVAKPNATAGVQIDGNEKGIIERHKDGSTVATLTLSGSGTATGDYTVGGKRATGNSTGTVAVTKDKNGVLTALDLTRATTVGGHAETVTTHLPLTNDADRQAVSDYLVSDAYTKEGQTALNLTWNDLAPSRPPGPGANPLQKLLYDKGQTSKLDYSYDSSQNNFGASLKLGAQLGLGVSLSSANQQLTGAQYLGAPGADGVRRYQNYKECHA